MQTSKFHNRKNVRRNLTQINTATTQKIYKTHSDDNPGPSSSGPRGQANVSGSQMFPPSSFLPGVAHGSMHQGLGQVIQHATIPVSFAVDNANIAPQMMQIAAPINQSQLDDLSRTERLRKGGEELNYYMSKEHVSSESKNKQPRHYRGHRSSSPESKSSGKRKSTSKLRDIDAKGHSRQEHRSVSRDHRDDRHDVGRSHSRSPRFDRRCQESGVRDKERVRELDHCDREIHVDRLDRFARDLDRHRELDRREREIKRQDHNQQSLYDNRNNRESRVRYSDRGEVCMLDNRNIQDSRDRYSDQRRNRNERRSYDKDDRSVDDRYDSYRDDRPNDPYLINEIDQRNVRYDDSRYGDSDRDMYEQTERVEEFDRVHYEHVQEASNYSGDRGYHDKRSLSPVSREEQSVKFRRELSPVSDGRSIGELKIHVSDRGRWIESDRNDQDLSPISDGDYDNRERNADELERRINNDRVTVENVSEGAYISDMEMVSDEETFSEHYFDNLTNWEQNDFYKREERLRDHGRSEHYSKRDEQDRHNRISESEHFNRHGDQRLEQGEIRGPKMALKLPNLCKHHNNTRQCKKPKCFALHVCRAYVLENCRHGDYCTKGHSFFSGQPYEILKKLNPDLENSEGMHKRLVIMLQRRILIAVGRSELLPIIDEKERELEKRLAEHSDKKHDKPERTDRGSHGFSESRESKVSSRPSNNEHSVNTDRHRGARTMPVVDNDSKTRHGRSERHKEGRSERNERNDRDKGSFEHRKEADRKQLDTKMKRDLSPVSGDEGNWEELEKYEKVSDDGMAVKDEITEKKVESELRVDKKIEQSVTAETEAPKADLDAVSPSRSDDGLSRPLDFPLPKPDHIAVPIGQNDPLVFNRPLGNNPQSYIGPLNRPPPSIPMMPNQGGRPLFPVQVVNPASNVAQFNPSVPPPVGISVPVPPRVPPPMGIPVSAQVPGVRPHLVPPPGAFPQPVPGAMVVPNHLPTPDFMKHVIQNLPIVKNTFKNDNTPQIIDITPGPSKKTEEKVVKDPELKEPIKTLWKFPHKTLVNMSIIEFVTETEAYKEEFVAELVRLLVTLQLPYVTMKKLLSVIKEKMMINIMSPTDMRKILDLYMPHFKIIETVESDDEDEEETRKRVQIKANITIGFCEKHGILPFAVKKCDCNALHVCKFYIYSKCASKHCKFGHKLKTEHNVNVLKNHKLHRLTGEELIDFMSDIDNRNRWTIPGLCKYYTREKGCYKGDNMDYDKICHSLHMCYFSLIGKCMNMGCDRAHDIRAKQPLSLLQKFGLDPDEYGDQKIVQLITEVINELDREKAVKNTLVKKMAETGKAGVGGDMSKKTDSKPSIVIKQVPMKRQTVTVPSICKFYQNELGCRKKDWGPEGKCLFVHVCQYYVTGDCKFGDKCKRSHDLYSGQVAELLKEYNIHTECLSVSIILGLLNKTGTIVELPVYDLPQVATSPEKIADTKEKGTDVESYSGFAQKGTASNTTAAQPLYDSQNIDDMIQRIISEKRVDKDDHNNTS